MNRRDFIKAFFSGVVVVSIPIVLEEEAQAKVEVFHEHEHYTARPGVKNIWYVHDEFWYLLSDAQRAPFEFDDSFDAERYVKTAGLIHYNNDNFNGVERFPNKEGMIKIRSAPQDIHDMSTLRQDDASIEATLNACQMTEPLHRELMHKLLAAQNGAEQSQIWVDYLDIKAYKKSIMALQFNKPFCQIIRGVYCSSTYHSELAKLQVFASPYTVGVARS